MERRGGWVGWFNSPREDDTIERVRKRVEGERKRNREDERMQRDEGEEIEQAAKHQIKLWGRQL